MVPGGSGWVMTSRNIVGMIRHFGIYFEPRLDTSFIKPEDGIENISPTILHHVITQKGYISFSVAKTISWVHACNVTAYRYTVS
jgi:hypothetical protein